MDVNNKEIPIRRGYLGRNNKFVKKASNLGKPNKPNKQYRNKFIQGIAYMKDYYLELDDASNHILSVLVAAFSLKMVQQLVSHLWSKKNIPSKEYLNNKIKVIRDKLMTEEKDANGKLIVINGIQQYKLKSKSEVCATSSFINVRTKELSKLNSKYMEHYGESAVDPEYVTEYLCSKPDDPNNLDTKSYPDKDNIKVKLVGSSEFGKRRSKKLKKSRRSRKSKRSRKLKK